MNTEVNNDDLSIYDYDLPPELIAQAPLAQRTDARLMIVDRNANVIQHKHIYDFPSFLRSNDVLVLNDTKVIPARLFGYRTQTGGHWEGLFLRFRENGIWELMSQTRGKLRNGELITIIDSEGRAAGQFEVLDRSSEQTLYVKPHLEDEALAFLDRVGHVPIPPYIRSGKSVPEDTENYQTVYAEHPGAVAAPTAGLHFTEELLEEIRKLGVAICPVTLHVGAGTFQPIKTEHINEHIMHSEYAEIDQKTVDIIKGRQATGGRVVAIGTTSVRTLESASNVRPDGSIDSSGLNQRKLQSFFGETNLFIRPPYQFKSVDVMLTNFHLPKSTLIILVRTFGGNDLLKRAYQEAIDHRYRFYSYGDAMLIL